MPASTIPTTFAGSRGETLAAAVDLPAGEVKAYALFAHCFTCSKDILAARRVSTGLAQLGIAVLRFDFTGLGRSEGEFAETNFSSNVEDLVLAANHLRVNFSAPTILIGHSLGGAAVLAAAGAIPEARAVVTIGAPADVSHVLHNFGTSIDKIKKEGEAEVTLAGRQFKIRNQFVEDAEEQRVTDKVASLGKALLVMHAPRDDIVGVENASKIFLAAKHPKSFVTLDDADHLLSKPADGNYAAGVIAAWVERYLPAQPTGANDAAARADDAVTVRETGLGKFQNTVNRRPPQSLGR